MTDILAFIIGFGLNVHFAILQITASDPNGWDSRKIIAWPLIGGVMAFIGNKFCSYCWGKIKTYFRNRKCLKIKKRRNK